MNHVEERVGVPFLIIAYVVMYITSIRQLFYRYIYNTRTKQGHTTPTAPRMQLYRNYTKNNRGLLTFVWRLFRELLCVLKINSSIVNFQSMRRIGKVCMVRSELIFILTAHESLPLVFEHIQSQKTFSNTHLVS